MDLYHQTTDRLVNLLEGRGVEHEIVPLTPQWRIIDVVAHLTGLASDIAGGMRQGMGANENTARQVQSRKNSSLEELFAEWRTYRSELTEAFAADPFFGQRLASDLIVHVHDIELALGLEPDPDDVATINGGETYAAPTPDRLASVAPLRIELSTGASYGPPDGGAEDPGVVTLRATPYDFLRAVTGRRSRSQVAAMSWHPGPAPSAVLDQLCPYGPLPDDVTNVPSQ